uniref:RRM domain-containing protein n=1 Tax=Bionectria ochroleuca TaxID=29856 RepID=A0A8H7K7D2_BIOOC
MNDSLNLRMRTAASLMASIMSLRTMPLRKVRISRAVSMPLTMSALPPRAVSEVESMSRRNRISRAVSEVESISRRNRVPRQSSHGPVATRPRKRAARKIRVARQSSHGPAATRKEESNEVDAQDIYPSTACIFVANLASNVADEELEEEVMAVFGKFGKAYVKLRRDTRNMPYAFVQYTSDNDAQRAFERAQGIKISDRCCRVEKAKANSVFAVSKRSGEPISEEEAGRLLRPLGPLSEISPLDYETQRKFCLPPSIRIQFTLFDSGRDPVKAFKDHRFFRVTSLELNKAPSTSANSSVNAKRDLEEVREMAVGCGKVLAVKVRTRSYVGGAEEICFAFVEFESVESVQDMIAAYDGIELRGYRLRLQRRQSRAVLSEDPLTPTPGRARGRAAATTSASAGGGGATPSSSRHTMPESWRGSRQQARQPAAGDESLKTPSRAAPTRGYPSSDRATTTEGGRWGRRSDHRAAATQEGRWGRSDHRAAATQEGRWGRSDRTTTTTTTQGRWGRIPGGDGPGNNSTQSSSSSAASASATPQTTAAAMAAENTNAAAAAHQHQDSLMRYLEQKTSEQASMLAHMNNNNHHHLTPPGAQQRALVAGAAAPQSAAAAAAAMPFGMNPFVMSPISPLASFQTAAAAAAAYMNAGAACLCLCPLCPGPFTHPRSEEASTWCLLLLLLATSRRITRAFVLLLLIIIRSRSWPPPPPAVMKPRPEATTTPPPPPRATGAASHHTPTAGPLLLLLTKISGSKKTD